MSVLCINLHARSILVRRTPVMFLEFAEEVRLIVESGLIKDLVDGERSGGQKLRGLLEPDVADKFGRRHAADGLELPIELHFAHRQRLL